jgi:hypothetical protein
VLFQLDHPNRVDPCRWATAGYAGGRSVGHDAREGSGHETRTSGVPGEQLVPGRVRPPQAWFRRGGAVMSHRGHTVAEGQLRLVDVVSPTLCRVPDYADCALQVRRGCGGARWRCGIIRALPGRRAGSREAGIGSIRRARARCGPGRALSLRDRRRGTSGWFPRFRVRARGQ